MNLSSNVYCSRSEVNLRIGKILIFEVKFTNFQYLFYYSEWFDESQVAIYQKLREDELFLKAFKKSVGYVKLLAELDLLRDVHKNEELEDEDDESNSLESGEELSIYDSNSVQSCDSTDSGLPKSHKRTNSNVSNSSTGKKISSPES